MEMMHPMGRGWDPETLPRARSCLSEPNCWRLARSIVLLPTSQKQLCLLNARFRKEMKQNPIKTSRDFGTQGAEQFVFNPRRRARPHLAGETPALLSPSLWGFALQTQRWR